MKRVLILVAISFLLCSTASTFQDGGGKSTKNSKPTRKPTPPSAAKPKVEPPKRSSTLGPSPVPTVTNAVGRSLAAFRGKVVIINFFATWAGPCREQTAVLVALQNKYRYKGLEVVGVSIDPIAPRGNPGGALAVAPFMKVNGINYHVWMIDNVAALAGFDVSQGIPTTYVLDREGRIVKTYVGVRPLIVYEDDIKQMLTEGEERRALPKAPMNAVNTKANPMAGIGLPLRDFEFDVVTVNSSAAETSRRKGQAQYCTEESAGMSLELVAVPGGTFLMGSTEHDTEKPPHQVTVGSFYLGKYEVTQTQWRQVASLPKVAHDLNSDPSSFKGDNLPVEQVSWEDAVEFCARLSRATGRSYRLPTEAEWEYACRAGTTTPFAFGQTITPQLVNYDGNHPYAQAPKGTYRETTTPVGFMGVANGFGLFDMHGNVGEWCMDYWHENYSGAPADGSSWETAGDTGNRVLRGGSWLLTASNARSACRYNFTPDFRSLNYGFRVVAVVRTP